MTRAPNGADANPETSRRWGWGRGRSTAVVRSTAVAEERTRGVDVAVAGLDDAAGRVCWPVMKRRSFGAARMEGGGWVARRRRPDRSGMRIRGRTTMQGMRGGGGGGAMRRLVRGNQAHADERMNAVETVPVVEEGEVEKTKSAATRVKVQVS